MAQCWFVDCFRAFQLVFNIEDTGLGIIVGSNHYLAPLIGVCVHRYTLSFGRESYQLISYSRKRVV